MSLRPEKQTPANQNLVNRWMDLPIDLSFPPEEFVDLIDSIDVISLIGVPDGKDLPVLAIIIDAIRKMHGLDYEGAKAGLVRAFERMPEDPI